MIEEPKGVLQRPWLWLPSQWAHDLAPYTLPFVSFFYSVKDCSYRPFDWRGLTFRNPMGIAGGLDKTGCSLLAWQKMGAGFLEVGTVTPEPQGPNPGKIMDRDVSKSALWNKMGFPNPGMEALVLRLQQLRSRQVPLFVNIGKNRWTENEKAHEDYGRCLERLHPFADVFVVNLSSPNTKGLRDLLSEAHLSNFLSRLQEKAQASASGKPLLLKLSPDMDESTLRMALETSSPLVDGWILTNTTKSRYPSSPFPADAGGVSGRPLTHLSHKALEIAAEYKRLNPEKLLVSVGGIDSVHEVQQRLVLGADLVQFYTALVFQGPGFFGKVLQELRRIPQ